MLYSGFDSLLPQAQREVNKPNGGFLPKHLLQEIDEMNVWVYDTVNNGVYKTGFASAQDKYEENIIPLFQSLDRLEEILSKERALTYSANTSPRRTLDCIRLWYDLMLHITRSSSAI